jgi:hypothetical protein
MSARVHTLSKSDFKLARSCATKLYYRELGYPTTLDENEYLQLLAEGGYMVEVLAKQLFPQGETMRYGRGHDAMLEAAATTMARLAAGDCTLFEPTLLEGHRLARVDILRRSPRGFDLYEVKSSSYDPAEADERIEKAGSPFRAKRKPFGILGDWRDYLEDVTYQVAVLKDLFPGVPVRPHLILMDKGKLAAHDGMPSWFDLVHDPDGGLITARFLGDPELVRRDPLTIDIDVSAEVAELEPEVRAAAAAFLATLHPELRRATPVLAGRCKACEFRVAPAESRNGFRECWGSRADARPHVLDLYQGGELRERLLGAGVDRLVDVEEEHLQGKAGVYATRQRRHIEQTRRDEEWADLPLADAIAAAQYPLHFIDFEAARIAVPHHKGMRPYGQLAFQWSCHTLRAPGAPLEHSAFLDREASWPNERFARSLRDRIGADGTVLVWSHFERNTLNEVAADLTTLGSGDPGLAEWLTMLARKPGTEGARQLDMLTLCRDAYYHPGMGSSYSIKYVLDAIWTASPEVRAGFAKAAGRAGDPALGPYAALPGELIAGEEQGVREGTGAIRAYFRMVYGDERTDTRAVEQWARLLLDYCELDTLAMVLIWEHWTRLAERMR